MAHQPSPSVAHVTSRPSLVDLICVAVLTALLWIGAQAIGGVTRASTLHPGATGHATAADCPTATPPPPAAPAGSMASLTLASCEDGAKTPATTGH